MEKQLSNSQAHVLMILNQQKQDLQNKFQELIDIENEQIKMVAKYYDFPEDKEYKIRQNQNSLFIYIDDDIEVKKME